MMSSASTPQRAMMTSTSTLALRCHASSKHHDVISFNASASGLPWWAPWLAWWIELIIVLLLHLAPSHPLPIMLKGHWQCFSLLHCCFLEGQLQVAAWLAQDKDFRGILWRLFVLARHPRNSRNSRHFRDGHRTWHEVGLLPELLLQRFSNRLGDILGSHTPASSNGNECFAQMGQRWTMLD